MPRGDRDKADADAQREALLLPHVAEVFDRAPELSGDFFRPGQRTAFHEDAEFVAAEARNRVAAPQLTVNQSADLAKQLIPRLATAGIVYDLESVHVQVAQNVVRRAAPLHYAGQALLEPLAAHQARHGVADGCVVGAARHPPPLGHIVKDEHHPGPGSVAVAKESRRIPDRDFRPIAPHQERAFVQVHRAPFADAALRDALDGLARRV